MMREPHARFRENVEGRFPGVAPPSGWRFQRLTRLMTAAAPVSASRIDLSQGKRDHRPGVGPRCPGAALNQEASRLEQTAARAAGRRCSEWRGSRSGFAPTPWEPAHEQACTGLTTTAERAVRTSCRGSEAARTAEGMVWIV